MSIELMKRVKRFRSKSSDLSFPDQIVDFESSNFSVSGVKPLHEVMDEIHSAFVWCWSVKDHLKKTLFDLSGRVDRTAFNKSFEDEIDNFEALTICADIANTEKHLQLNRPPRSGRLVKLDVAQSIRISPETVSQIQRLNGCYYIVPKNNKAVELKANIVDENGVVVMDAFQCLDKSIEAWDTIESYYANI
ncbi:MAG: hypothetical protein L0G80_18915 [Shewanella sp.]|uniref:hypothetical protein n=1 Tax=Shewanella sp. TaxID=50422 RepID=UPI0026491936|nr:hypothetical protein [Shewanella sp.]MDN5501977.1 hypothetical protein [Shewanella sp.]MDN5529983.1 hypothetical protein [Shewanella sp.]